MVHKHERELSLDEAMISFIVRSSLKQYLPMKPTKRGFKVLCLCETSSDFLALVSTGATEHTEFNLGEKIVLNVSAPFRGLRHAIFCDNFFSSFKLAQQLLLQNNYMCYNPKKKEEVST